MELQTFNIFDDLFPHVEYSVAGQKSEYIKWDRSLKNLSLPTFYSHGSMSLITKNLSN